MSYKNTDLKATHHALKVLKDGFRKAQTAHQKRADANAAFTADLNRKYPAGHYDKAYYDAVIYPKIREEVKAWNEKSKQTFVKDMGQTTGEMLEAVRTLREAKDFRTQALDFSDQTLINALRMLDTYGKDMPFEEQRNLCLSFSGDMPALRAIENGMKKNGMRYSEIAHKLQAPVNSDFLDEAENVIYRMMPEVSENPSFDRGQSYMLWFNREIDEKAEIYGLDLSVDPYREAIRKTAYKAGADSEWSQDFHKEQEAHKLVREWEKDLREMESRGESEQANRSAKQIFDVLTSDGVALKE